MTVNAKRTAIHRGYAPVGAAASRAVRLLLTAAVLALLLAILLTAVLARAPLFDYRTVILGGGSMEPALHNGSLLVSQRAEPHALQEGDVITFSYPGSSATITHRIVSAREDEGHRWFTVKGDANRTPDPDELNFDSTTPYRMSFAIPFAGYAIGFLTTPLAGIIFVVLPLLSLAALRIIGVRAARPMPGAR